MGYTVYFTQVAKPLDELTLVRVRQLLDHGYLEGVLCGFADYQWCPPATAPTRIRFNGVGPQACETFVWSVRSDFELGPDGLDSFCKTNGRPYDRYVKAVLLLLGAAGFVRQVSCDWYERDAMDFVEAELLLDEVLGLDVSYEDLPRTAAA